MTLVECAVQTASALVGSFGFCLIYGTKRRHIASGSIGGALCWAVFLIGYEMSGSVLAPTMAASAFAALWSQVIAQVQRTPTTIIFLPTIIPLIPGRTLYYAMSSAAHTNWDEALEYAELTFLYAAGIAVGVSLVWAAVIMIKQSRDSSG